MTVWNKVVLVVVEGWLSCEEGPDEGAAFAHDDLKEAGGPFCSGRPAVD